MFKPGNSSAGRGTTVEKYVYGMMLSAMMTLAGPYLSVDARNSSITRLGDRLRNAMPSPFNPQKVQWCFCPHQQPRLVSYGTEGCPTTASSGRLRYAARCSK